MLDTKYIGRYIVHICDRYTGVDYVLSSHAGELHRVMVVAPGVRGIHGIASPSSQL